MVAIKLYDIETGHVETLARVSCEELAEAWLRNFRTGGCGTNDVIYLCGSDEGRESIPG